MPAIPGKKVLFGAWSSLPEVVIDSPSFDFNVTQLPKLVKGRNEKKKYLQLSELIRAIFS